MTSPYAAPTRAHMPVPAYDYGGLPQVNRPVDFKSSWTFEPPKPKKLIIPFNVRWWRTMLTVERQYQFASLHKSVQDYLDAREADKNIPAAYRRVR